MAARNDNQRYVTHIHHSLFTILRASPRRLNPVLPQHNPSLWRLICQETGSPRGEFGNTTYSTRTIRKAVTVRANWRVIFRFADGAALDVDYVDYH
jgi:hypothetical protein